MTRCLNVMCKYRNREKGGFCTFEGAIIIDAFGRCGNEKVVCTFCHKPLNECTCEQDEKRDK